MSNASPMRQNSSEDGFFKESDLETPVVREEHFEGALAVKIEDQAKRIPSYIFLLAAFGAMGASLALELQGQKRRSEIVGMWPAPLLLFGIYNKIVKTVSGNNF